MNTLGFLPFNMKSNRSLFGAFLLATGLLAGGPSIAQDGNFSDGQAEEIKGYVREYILENPEIIAEAITLLQANQETEKSDRQRQNLQQLQSELQNPPEQTIIGNPDGEVTVVEFFDYNCGYCKSMFETVLETMQDNNDLRLVLIEFPILGPNSVIASKAALAARKQDLYGPFHQALMSHRGGIDEATVMTLARGVGINVNQLKLDMKDPELDEIIEKNRSMAQKLEINGTPAFVVGDALVPGAISAEQFNELIKQASSPG
jgi:protein-disulfide isomerase